MEEIDRTHDPLAIHDTTFQYSPFKKFIAKWEQEKGLKQKEHDNARNTTVRIAKETMQLFLSERESLRESKQSSNREEEQTRMERLVGELDSENPWERVSTLIDINTCRKKGSKSRTITDSSSSHYNNEVDVSRMRQIFIQLKNEPLESTRKAAPLNK